MGSVASCTSVVARSDIAGSSTRGSIVSHGGVLCVLDDLSFIWLSELFLWRVQTKMMKGVGNEDEGGRLI